MSDYKDKEEIILKNDKNVLCRCGVVLKQGTKVKFWQRLGPKRAWILLEDGSGHKIRLPEKNEKD